MTNKNKQITNINQMFLTKCTMEDKFYSCKCNIQLNNATLYMHCIHAEKCAHQTDCKL